MTRTALRADAGRSGRDPLGAAGDILARAAAAGRSPTLFERAQLRATVKAHEAATGRSLLAEAETIAARERGGLLDAADRQRLTLLLDLGEALG
jgi:hypothetical protein